MFKLKNISNVKHEIHNLEGGSVAVTIAAQTDKGEGFQKLIAFSKRMFVKGVMTNYNFNWVHKDFRS